jgi:hypothetical protein
MPVMIVALVRQLGDSTRWRILDECGPVLPR